MMTNKQHDDLWMGAAGSLLTISDSLRRSNMITILKKLHDMGKLSDDDYMDDLLKIAKSEGFIITIE